jgi:hypothetical protein
LTVVLDGQSQRATGSLQRIADGSIVAGDPTKTQA